VCAAARTTMIMGMYPGSAGGEHMRSMMALPEELKMFPVYLREAGYHCTNNGKEDFNHPKEPYTVWDKGTYKNREEGQPFFAVFNHTGTHESKLRGKKELPLTDPAKVYVPSYMPDEPIVRREWANYIDNINTMDGWVGQQLDQLEKEGLAETTIVVFWGDHGAGMPRNKRYPGNSGLSVPLLVYVPERFQGLAPDEYAPGGVSDRMVGFVDLGATMLSLAGVEAPATMHGRPFMGSYESPMPQYNYGFRGRMDERPDLVRSLRNGRYLYMRNYAPLRTGAQFVQYQHATETTALWKQRFDEGALNDVQAAWWKLTPVEEFYDLQEDPDETINLVNDPAHAERVQAFRDAHREMALTMKDTTFLPEQLAWNLGQKEPLYSWAQEHYDIEAVFAAAQAATSRDPGDEALCVTNCGSDDPALRYWGALGLHVLGAEVVGSHRELLRGLLGDDSHSVRIAAAEGLAMLGNADDQEMALATLGVSANSEESGGIAAMYAFNSLEMIVEAHPELKEKVAALGLESVPTNDSRAQRSGGYVKSLKPRLLAMCGVEWEEKKARKEKKK
ncbi:MAG: sulfatase-like hydrolase/transferase, partial [Verrucomicrobiota bacterium]